MCSAPQGGGPIRRTIWAARFFRPAVQRAGLAPLRIHDLRHTAVALWIAAGASTLAITRWAGHSSSAFVLDRYGHLLDGPAATATACLD
ncbi:tyrosine-type recombinase/integrase [Aciditerrimonas ferrireducens]|uniref:tyrosine-type recombinase/integrase n=1 Tax=Aciditerrimonas ferrireducens TaxID=667306 RepID=UPI002003E887|nr:tyrosine-type recombinase/integrase [Aciditerrimonas ferrireducens]MCK4176997.1 tyrosine-type recombinase/integrase [Aciditerrimonas ferrireducens]